MKRIERNELKMLTGGALVFAVLLGAFVHIVVDVTANASSRYGDLTRPSDAGGTLRDTAQQPSPTAVNSSASETIQQRVASAQ
jgi:hypothetical protein